MLKLLLGHWQAHREPLPFVLTDDPLYCSHLTSGSFPEVYSVNRVNPLYEEQRNDKCSDDTGYCSSPFGDGGSRRMSSDSDESSAPAEVIVLADVHRVSNPDDVIRAPSNDSDSLGYDSPPNSMSGEEPTSTSAVREKLQRLLERGNEKASQPTDRSDLMKSLNRALQDKVPKENEVVTRTDDAKVPERRKSSSAKESRQSSSGVTRQDESSSNDSRGKPRRTEKEESSDNSHKCKICAHRPLAFHQLLPGHWSYDNIYLPAQIPNICYHCLHRNPMVPSSEDDLFYPLYYHQEPKTRHSWAPRERSSSLPRSSPDGSSRETTDSSNKRERRSLRVPKKCHCEECLGATLGKTTPCPCCARRVTFAPERIFKDPIFTHTNKSSHAKENGKPPKNFLPRGLKEPIKMDELYHSYPISFRDWEAHYRRTFLKKRRKRALNMVGMAIGIILVVGIATALTFVFLRIKRPV